MDDIFIRRLFSLDGKTAVVTGGAGGLGSSISQALLQGGAKVIIVSRNAETCEKAAQSLRKFGDCDGIVGDLSSEEETARLAENLGSRLNRLDILVNNAGATWGESFSKFPWKAWNRAFSVNVFGLFELTKRLKPLLAQSATPEYPARVINLGSVVGTIPLADNSYSYASSKAAVHHLTKILANELGKENITVNALAPGPFLSKMTAFALGTEAGQAAASEGIPLGRIGNPDDIAGAVLFLCGKAGAYINGAILPVDGGMHIKTQDHMYSLQP